jgi:hypothetical protein
MRRWRQGSELCIASARYNLAVHRIRLLSDQFSSPSFEPPRPAHRGVHGILL